MKLRIAAAFGMLASLVAGVLVLSTGPASSATQVCPPNPAKGSTIFSAVNVTGVCKLDTVTVFGPITVQNGGALELENATIYNNITVNSGGELFVGHVANTGIATYRPSTIYGTVTITNAPDSDIDGAHIFSSVTVNGIQRPAFISVCGSRIDGGLTINNGGFVIGDPDADAAVFAGGTRCTTNKISSVSLNTIPPAGALVAKPEMEGNTVAGSVTITNGRVEFEDNTVGANVSCTSGGSAAGGDEPLSSNHVAAGITGC